MKRWLPVTVAILGVAVFALAGPIKVWSNGDYVLSSDLNANFQHIHDTMVGGHGPRLTNADVAPNAGIALSKLAQTFALPSYAFQVGSGPTPCASGTCTVTGLTGGGVTVTAPVTGEYDIVFTTPLSSASYVVLANGAIGVGLPICQPSPTIPRTASKLVINCWYSGSGEVATFDVVIFGS